MKANVAAICREVVDQAARANLPVRNVWGYGQGPDHNNRRCLDFMVTSRAGGDWVAGYLWTHRKRLGLELTIWHRIIRRTYRKGILPAGTRQPYKGRSSHTDHVHAQFREMPYLPLPDGVGGVWEVDPAKVSSYLWQIRPDGSRGAKRKPGYLIKTGVRWENRNGRKWLVTSGGNRYAAEFLREV